jgi:hypothetical protein
VGNLLRFDLKYPSLVLDKALVDLGTKLVDMLIAADAVIVVSSGDRAVLHLSQLKLCDVGADRRRLFL